MLELNLFFFLRLYAYVGKNICSWMIYNVKLWCFMYIVLWIHMLTLLNCLLFYVDYCAKLLMKHTPCSYTWVVNLINIDNLYDLKVTFSYKIQGTCMTSYLTMHSGKYILVLMILNFVLCYYVQHFCLVYAFEVVILPQNVYTI